MDLQDQGEKLDELGGETRIESSAEEPLTEAESTEQMNEAPEGPLGEAELAEEIEADHPEENEIVGGEDVASEAVTAEASADEAETVAADDESDDEPSSAPAGASETEDAEEKPGPETDFMGMRLPDPELELNLAAFLADEPVTDEEAVAAEEAGAEEALAEEPDDGRGWYVVHCYSGYENKVRHNLEQRIESMGMKDKIFDVVVPTEEEIEVKEGKRRTVERRVFPGYILVNMIMTEESWYVVRNTPGVTGFVGMGNTPIPLRPEEVAQIIKRMEADAPRIKVTFKPGERVRIIDGPFNDFRGTVAEIDMERAKVRVMVNFFGRETPVELDFLQVEKA